MHFVKFALVTLLLLELIVPSECGWWRRVRRSIRRAWRKVKGVARKVKNAIQKVFPKVSKTLCKWMYAIKCTWKGSVLKAVSRGDKSTALRRAACHLHKAMKAVCKKWVRVNRKRSVDSQFTILPFPGNFTEYDTSNDKVITYEEFQLTLIKHFKFNDSNELHEAFLFADVDGDQQLTTDEFKGAPFLFAHMPDKELDSYELVDDRELSELSDLLNGDLLNANETSGVDNDNVTGIISPAA